MRALIVFLALAASVAGQAVVEDFRCQIPAGITAGNLTQITCDGPHGFEEMRASAVLSVGQPVAGDTITLGTRTYRFVTDLAGCAAGDVKIADAADYGSFSTLWVNSAYHLAAAINGDASGWTYNGATWSKRPLQGTQYCASTGAHPDAAAYGSFVTSSATLYVMAKAGGTAGQIAVGKSGAAAWLQRNRATPATQLNIQWTVRVFGATGAWAGIGATHRLATSSGTGTFTIAYDSSAAGSAAEQSWIVRRAAYDGTLYFFHAANDYPGPVEAPQNGTMGVFIYGCAATDSDEQCGKAFVGPDNQKDYGNVAPITSFVVSGGVGTVTVGSWRGTAYGYTAPGPGVRFFLRGFDKYFLTKTITGATNNGGGLVRLTAAVHGCAAGDKINVSGVAGVAGANGIYDAIIVDANHIDLPGSVFGGVYASGGTFACNPDGFAPQAEAGHFTKRTVSGMDSKAPAMQSFSGATFTFNTSLADGVYTSTGLQARVQVRTNPYMYLYPRTTPSGANWYAPIDQVNFHIKSGTYSPDMNRMRFWVRWGANAQKRGDGGYTTNIGTYTVPSLAPHNLRAHFYHYTGANAYADRWMQYEINGAPAHEVGAVGGTLWPNNPTAGHPYYPSWLGGSPNWNYLRGNNLTYFDTAGLGTFDTELGLGNTTALFGRIELDTAANEPEEWVRARTSVYSPQRYRGGTLLNEGGYEIGWGGVPFGPETHYEVRYSAVQSIRTLGWSNATPGGAITVPNFNYGYSQWLWQSPEMPEGDNFWAAIRPAMPVVGASTAGQPVWLIFRGDPGMQAGDKVAVSGAGGSRDSFETPIAEVAPRKIWFADRPPTEEEPAWRSGGGKLVLITAASGICTATLSEAHGLTPGWRIEISGSTSAALGAAPGNYASARLYTVDAVLDANSFTFNCPGVAGGAYATSGAGLRMNIHAFPGVRLNATADSAWSGGGTMSSTEEFKNFAQVYLPRYTITGTAPAAPCSLTATALSSSSIGLTWGDCSTTETHFVVERKTGAGGTFTPAGTAAANTTSFTDNGLQANTTYTYRVLSWNAHGASAPSPEATAATLASGLPPQPPDTLEALNVGSIQLTLAWRDNANDERGFVVEMDAGLGFVEAGRTDANVTEYAVLGLQPSTAYSFRVRAFNEFGFSAYSATVTVSTSDLMSGRLGGLALQNTLLLFYYPLLPGACQWTMRPTTGAAITGSDGGGGRARTVVVSGLSPGTNHDWQVACGGRAAVGKARTPAAQEAGQRTVQVNAQRGAAAADNLILEYGAASNQLTQRLSVACTTPRCQANLPASGQTVIWVRRVWCSQRLTDPDCLLPANRLARSEPEAISVP